MSVSNGRRSIDWNVILLAIIAATPPTIMAWRAADKVDAVAIRVAEVHKATNGLTATIAAAAAEKGRIDGEKDEKTRAATEKADRERGAKDERQRQGQK